MRFHCTVVAFVSSLLLLLGMVSALPVNRYGVNGNWPLQVLSFDPDAGSTSLAVRCPNCADPSSSEGRNPLLVFNFTLSPSRTPDWLSFGINDVTLDLSLPSEQVLHTSRLVTVSDTRQSTQHANISIVAVRLPKGSPASDSATHRLRFDIVSWGKKEMTLRPGFSIDVAPSASLLLRRVRSEPYGPEADANTLAALTAAPEVDEATHELAADAAALLLLEAQAEDLRVQIDAKKQAVAAHLKDHRDHVSLKHLLDECDSLLCTARVIAQRICDKMGVDTETSIGYSKLGNDHDQQPIPSATTGQGSPTAQREQAHLRLMLSKNATSDEYKYIHVINPTNPLIRALEIICSALGLAALVGLIKARCASARTKADRAAAREERRTARAYRRAARRAAMRKRWGAFVDAINCFGRGKPARNADYDEKRALILQDAFLEQLNDADSAEKGETMEAEIRELRHAHDLVAGLVNADERRQNLTHHARDPPPPLVPMPRSRASTQTLPPYISDAESLPSYRSRPITLGGSNSSVMTTSPSISDDEEFVASNSSHTRYSPGSSVVNTSPRISAETLRTILSKSTQTRWSTELK